MRRESPCNNFVSPVIYLQHERRRISGKKGQEAIGWPGERVAGLAREATDAKKVAKRRHQSWWRKGTARQRMERLNNWENSVRGTTNWEPPRMPDDVVAVDVFRL
jgi:hypothetical protein